MDSDQQMDDRRGHDAASSGFDADQPADVLVVATAVNPDQHPSSCPPLCQPGIPPQEPLERSNYDQHGGAQKRKRTESVNNENPPSEPVASSSEPSAEDERNFIDFDTTRRTLKEIIEKLPVLDYWGDHWQDHTTDVRAGAVIIFPHFTHANTMDDRSARSRAVWNPALQGFTVSLQRLAIVEKNDGRGALLLCVFTGFDDDSPSSMREHIFLDPITNELRSELEDLLHIIALDNTGPPVSEPQCFNLGIQLNWRKLKHVRVPIGKSSFMRVDEYPRLLRPTSLCVVGELAEDDDFLILKSTRDALNKNLDKGGFQEIKRRREDRTHDPSQEPGPYTRRYTHESPAYCPQSPNYDPGAGSLVYRPTSPNYGGGGSPWWAPTSP